MRTRHAGERKRNAPGSEFSKAGRRSQEGEPPPRGREPMLSSLEYPAEETGGSSVPSSDRSHRPRQRLAYGPVSFGVGGGGLISSGLRQFGQGRGRREAESGKGGGGSQAGMAAAGFRDVSELSFWGVDA